MNNGSLRLAAPKELFMFRRTPRMNALGVFSLPLNTIVLCLGPDATR